MTNLITTSNRALTAKEFQGLTDEKAAIYGKPDHANTEAS